MLSNAEQRAYDEVRSLSQRVYRLQVGRFNTTDFYLANAVNVLHLDLEKKNGSNFTSCRLVWTLSRMPKKFAR